MSIMKKIILSISLAAFIMVSGYGQLSMKFNKTVHDYGNIKYSSKDGEYDFTFENTGDKPIVLTNVKSSCGCTVPQWSKKPVQPGETSKIKVVYNTTIPGKFSKTVTVYSNAGNSPVKLQVKGNVTITMAEAQKIKETNQKNRELMLDANPNKSKTTQSGKTKMIEEEGPPKNSTGKKATFKKISTRKKVGSEYKKINTTKKIKK